MYVKKLRRFENRVLNPGAAPSSFGTPRCRREVDTLITEISDLMRILAASFKASIDEADGFGRPTPQGLMI